MNTREENPDSLPAKARTFAVAAHSEQKYGERPYSWHLDSVVALLAPYGEQAQVAGYLHDVVEDTSVGLDEVRENFGDAIAASVALLTDAPGATRKERKAKTYAKLAEVRGENQVALVVKVADRLANVRACVADGKQDLLQIYREEHPVFRNAAYRPGVCEPLWLELDRLLGWKVDGISKDTEQLEASWKKFVELYTPDWNTFSSKGELLSKVGREDIAIAIHGVIGNRWDEWISTPVPALGDKTALECLKTDAGIALLKKILRRIHT